MYYSLSRSNLRFIDLDKRALIYLFLVSINLYNFYIIYYIIQLIYYNFYINLMIFILLSEPNTIRQIYFFIHSSLIYVVQYSKIVIFQLHYYLIIIFLSCYYDQAVKYYNFFILVKKGSTTTDEDLAIRGLCVAISGSLYVADGRSK